MDDVGLVEVACVFLDALVQRNRGESGRGFDLDGGDIVSTGDGTFGDEEIDFHPLFFILPVRIGIEEQFASDGGQHLCDDVFHQHACIDIQFIFEDFLIEFPGDDPPLIECVTDHQSRVVHIAFQGIVFLFETQADARFGRVECEVDHPGIAKPEERAVIVPEAGVFFQVGQHELVFVQLELPGDRFINGADFGRVRAGVIVDAVVVKIQDFSWS